MTALRALIRKELLVLFGSPMAYLVAFMVALVTAVVFFEHLRVYNQILFVFASTTMGGFESDTIPDHVNLRDTLFMPVMDQLGLLLVIPIPLITMRVFAEERARGTDELLATSLLSPAMQVAGKFAVSFAFVTLLMAISFLYPLSAVRQGGVGAEQLAAVFLGLTLLALGITSLGLACSAFARSQLAAAAATVAIVFVAYDMAWMYSFVGSGTAQLLEALSMRSHFARFAEGLVLLEDVAYFAALAAVCAALSRASLELKRVSG
jgi:ABC-2 type transport system permease protein